MGIGRISSHVFHVTDLEVGQRFWSEVTGIDPIPSVFPGRSAYLGEAAPRRSQIVLWKVDEPKGLETNGSHLDIWVDDVDVAIDQILDIGGNVKRPPTIYPRPHAYPDEPSRVDWAVMRDPFGNEFCLISALTPDERNAVADAGQERSGDDDHWRQVAGPARKRWWTNQVDDNNEQEHGHGHTN